MNKYTVKVHNITSSPVFCEASREELRALLAIIEKEGEITSAAALAEAAGISQARASSSIALWEEAGVIAKCDDVPTVTEEFEERIALGKITERTSAAVAREIRDSELGELISECAALMKRAALSPEEIKIITALYSQLALDEEYILTLAAYIDECGRLTAERLGADAERLVKKGITTPEALNDYITQRQNESGAEWEFKRTVGIWNRSLTKSEQKYVNRWYGEFGFGSEIVGEAYDITVLNTSKLNLPYMDKILTAWHEAGCKTVEECRAAAESERARLAQDDAKKNDKRPPKLPRQKATTPRYGNFDPLDAFEKALQRSYGDEDDD